jgi:hypothetical protein
MTAVEWLMEQITFDSDGERWASYKECCDLKEYFQQALEIEKQQIIDAYIEGYTMPQHSADATQYYYLTYKTNNP